MATCSFTLFAYENLLVWRAHFSWLIVLLMKMKQLIKHSKTHAKQKQPKITHSIGSQMSSIVHQDSGSHGCSRLRKLLSLLFSQEVEGNTALPISTYFSFFQGQQSLIILPTFRVCLLSSCTLLQIVSHRKAQSLVCIIILIPFKLTSKEILNITFIKQFAPSHPYKAHRRNIIALQLLFQACI